MFWIFYLIFFVGIISLMLFGFKKWTKRQKYEFQKDKGPYYFENGMLYLNAAFPQKAEAVPVEEIDHIKFTYDIKSVEIGKYTLGLQIFKKDGTATKNLGFVIAPYVNPLDPYEAARDLEAHGLRCELPAGRGTWLGNRE